jgi:hypothetical protein
LIRAKGIDSEKEHSDNDPYGPRGTDLDDLVTSPVERRRDFLKQQDRFFAFLLKPKNIGAFLDANAGG